MEIDTVYLIAKDQNAARDWAYRNRRWYIPKIFHPDSMIGPRGLVLSDGTAVYVLDPPATEVRDAWIAAGAHLMYI